MADEVYDGPPTDLGNINVYGAVRNPFGISAFIAEIDKRGGTLNPNLFSVEIKLPVGVDLDRDSEHTLNLLCESAHFPGVTLGTDDSIQRYGWGPTHRVVWGMVFTPLTLEFIIDTGGATHRAITSWMNNIISYNLADDAIENQPSDTDGLMPFMVNYSDEYSSEIYLYTWDAVGKRAIRHMFLRVFPIRINEVPLSSSMQNGLTKMTVQFSYTRHNTAYMRLDREQNEALEQATTATVAARRDALQAGVSGASANNLVGNYRSMFTPTPAAFPPITDSFLNFSNGILANPTTRPVDSLFDTNTLFPEG